MDHSLEVLTRPDAECAPVRWYSQLAIRSRARKTMPKSIKIAPVKDGAESFVSLDKAQERLTVVYRPIDKLKALPEKPSSGRDFDTLIWSTLML